MRLLRKFDSYAARVELNYGEGVSSFPTNTGAILSICTNLIGLSFLLQCLFVLRNHRGTQFTSSTETKYFDLDDTMSEENGL